jgi:hypothetical protein
MHDRLAQLLSADRVGRTSALLPAFAGWGTGWQFGGGPDDRTPAARAGVFPIALDSAGGGPDEAQVRAVEWLVAEQRRSPTVWRPRRPTTSASSRTIWATRDRRPRTMTATTRRPSPAPPSC